MVKIVCFSMFGKCHGKNRHFLHGWKVSWAKSSLSAWLGYSIVEIVCFSLAESDSLKCQFQLGWNRECIMIKIVSFRMARKS
jgi:hypothetical protein